MQGVISTMDVDNNCLIPQPNSLVETKTSTDSKGKVTKQKTIRKKSEVWDNLLMIIRKLKPNTIIKIKNFCDPYKNGTSLRSMKECVRCV